MWLQTEIQIQHSEHFFPFLFLGDQESCLPGTSNHTAKESLLGLVI